MLKTLAEFNIRRTERIKRAPEIYHDYNAKTPTRNGIACPRCKRELFDTNRTVITGNPPQLNVHCLCGFTGTRFK